MTIGRSDWRLATLGNPRSMMNTTLGLQILGAVTSSVADLQTPLFNLLLDGNHSYWVVQSADAPLLQTISATLNAATTTEKAYLVHNKGG